MKARELMTYAPVTVTPEDSVSHAAVLMRDYHVGSLPVVEPGKTPVLVGIITDRDITMRCTAKGHLPSCRVQEHMTVHTIHSVHAESDVTEVLDKMDRAQVRRLPVVTEDHVLVGIIAQADIATKFSVQSPMRLATLLERLSEPSLLMASPQYPRS
jgi:CBS domain-containing protein